MKIIKPNTDLRQFDESPLKFDSVAPSLPKGMSDLSFIEDKYGLTRIGALLPSGPTPQRFPSLRQCVGTKRLWGAPLGLALHGDLEGHIALQPLVDIAILSRAVLVIEDFLDDEFCDKQNERRWLVDLLANLLSELRHTYSVLGEDFDELEELRLRANAEVVMRSNETSMKSIYDSSIEKCLIFFNPFRLKIAREMPQYVSRMVFLEAFFFACQLLDDFQDLREDRLKRLNHNIFYAEGDPSSFREIELRRLNWAPAMLAQIHMNLNRNDIRMGASGSVVFEYYLSAALYFVGQMLLIMPACMQRALTEVKMIPFQNWKFDPLGYNQFEMAPQRIEAYLRPEFLQTYARGIRDVFQV